MDSKLLFAAILFVSLVNSQIPKLVNFFQSPYPDVYMYEPGAVASDSQLFVPGFEHNGTKFTYTLFIYNLNNNATVVKKLEFEVPIAQVHIDGDDLAVLYTAAR